MRFNFKLDPKIVKLDKFFIHTIIYFWNIFLEVYILHILDKNSISYQSLNGANSGSRGPSHKDKQTSYFEFGVEALKKN